MSWRSHADDIAMFDVPPPHEGVRGMDAYRETWPPFFEWQAQAASFEIVSMEVTAGDDVAYAHALLRCGTPQELAEHTANRLRLTVGLRKEQDRWVVASEHASFPWSAPIDHTRSVFVVLQTPVTSAPNTLASCTANVPGLPPHR